MGSKISFIYLYFLVFQLTSVYIGGGSVLAQSQNTIPSPILHKELDKHFMDCHVEGSIIIYDRDLDAWIVSDTVDIYEGSLPASTFKILNLLIALETGVIDDEEEVIPYKGNVDTTKYGYRPGTYRDMTVREAFEASAVWVFLDLAERIGKDTYREYLQKIGYGNKLANGENLDFWNFGELDISPVNQVKFLIDLYDYRLPFSKINIDIVKDVMLSEIGKNYTVHGKTGWTREGGINIGWWIGYIEKGNSVYVFTTRIRQDRENNKSDFGQCRKMITEKVFQELKLLNP